MPGISHRELLERLNRFDPMEAMAGAVTGTQEDFIALVQDQLQHGKDGRGNDLPRYKNPAYRAMKMRMNPLNGGRYDFKMTGAFYNAAGVVVMENRAEGTSDDWKLSMLMAMSNSSILDLNPESLKRYREVLHPLILRAHSSISGLKIVSR